MSLWVRVNRFDSHIIFAGGTDTKADVEVSWAKRSRDGGTTWEDLTAALGLANINPICSETVAPFVLAHDIGHLYATIVESCGSPNASGTSLMRSADNGKTWQVALPVGSYGGGAWNPAVSGAMISRVYAVTSGGDGDYAHIQRSDDFGVTWKPCTDIPDLNASNAGIDHLAASACEVNTVRAFTVTYDNNNKPVPFATFISHDAGKTWSKD